MIAEIPKRGEWEQKVFSISNDESFRSIALDLYQFQFHHNPVYQRFCELLHRTPQTVDRLEDVPFLPISFFKTHRVVTTDFEPGVVFASSGTTGTTTSSHFLKSEAVYRQSFLTAFEQFYGNPGQYCILGLLPSYLERGQSSLVYMVNELVKLSGHPDSGFYLYNFSELDQTLARLEAKGQPTLLIGVTYALLDFAAQFPRVLKHTTVMETGGMKGRKKELTRSELHTELKEAFGLEQVHAEYGMTELLSQAYAREGRFLTPPWMKLGLRDETDPLSLLLHAPGRSGAINVIDLANIYSCSFIATEDMGRMGAEGMEILGRMDNSDIRGCSLMAV